MFCLLFLTSSPIENTQRYHKIVLGGVKFQISLKVVPVLFPAADVTENTQRCGEFLYQVK